MLKTLFATCLLLFSCSNGSLKQEAIEQPYQSNIRESSHQLLNFGGSYNYKDFFDGFYYDLLDDLGVVDGDSVVFNVENPQNPDFHPYICPVDFSDNVNQQLYLSKITFTFESDDSIYIIYDCFDLYNNIFQKSENFYWGESIENVNYPKLIFNYTYSSLLHDEYAIIFEALYTHSANTYTQLYSGYYSFDQNLVAINQKISLFGSFTFNDSMWLGLTNVGIATNVIDFLYFDIENSVNALKLIQLPFSGEISDNRFYFNNVRLTKEDYNYLSGVGVFAYVRDSSHDNDTFKDLLFGVMDSPLYFIHMLFNFELFGYQLYVAFASLLTVLIAVLFIRKLL